MAGCCSCSRRLLLQQKGCVRLAGSGRMSSHSLCRGGGKVGGCQGIGQGGKVRWDRGAGAAQGRGRRGRPDRPG